MRQSHDFVFGEQAAPQVRLAWQREKECALDCID
jgi:hypothetical protein